MGNWLPFWIGFILAVAINMYPWFMAFVLKKEGWGMVGWVYYFFTIPIGIVLFVLGLLISLFMVA